MRLAGQKSTNPPASPGGGVEHAEDPYDAVIREVAEETGLEAVAERLLGVDSRVIPAAERRRPGAPELQNVGVGHVAPVPVGGLIHH
ncbi:NUDIX hydrolase [Streptomyces sp. NPDC058542]|uniref:NUDIX hydrolase n=1 Tax=Streptomyces sp. NPDC058542 TaxID=3346543 RepID=UPI00364AFE16